MELDGLSLGERVFEEELLMAGRPPRADNYEYHELPLPAFPQILVTVALEIANGKLWFPITTICEDGLHIDSATQRAKIKDPEGEYVGKWDEIPFETSRGWKDTVCLEFEPLGQWFTSIQER